ncbi:sugar phosphate isomerase/epimerase family protein [Streptomyces sp. NPDC102274]|uniref:sugar phosphate isomerase/epimerase family protein n=1 Tax=Streptomyces sp. NPDC102274 TaxID=3366151 RepID=UPI0038301DCA
MRLIVLTKPFGSTGVGRLADRLASLGVDGADLLVRAGQAVTPDAPEGIGAAARTLVRAGLGLDIVTTDLTTAGPQAERIIGSCAEAGVPLVRIGFYRYPEHGDYATCLDEARRQLDSLVHLAAAHGVRPALQLHHGTLHISAAHALRLLEGHGDVLVYADPGNQAKEGSEDWRLGLDMLGIERIGCVGVKNAVWRRGTRGWECDWQPLADGGVVNWPKILPELLRRGYRGPLSLHVHYPFESLEHVLQRDVDHLRGLVADARRENETR